MIIGKNFQVEIIEVFMDTLVEQAEQGVDSSTIHAGTRPISPRDTPASSSAARARGQGRSLLLDARAQERWPELGPRC